MSNYNNVLNIVPTSVLNNLVTSKSTDIPSFTSLTNDFDSQNIRLKTTMGYYYLRVNDEGSYWIHENYMNRSTFTSFQYLSSSSEMRVCNTSGYSNVYIALDNQAVQDKVSSGNCYLTTIAGNLSRKMKIFKMEEGYLIKTLDDKYLSLDMTQLNGTYNKYPAVLSKLTDQTSPKKLAYLEIHSYVHK